MSAGHQARSFFDGGQGHTFGSTKEHILDRIVASNLASISLITNLVVSKHVSSSSTFRTGVPRTVERHPQPVAQAATELLIVEVKTLGR